MTVEISRLHSNPLNERNCLITPVVWPTTIVTWTAAHTSIGYFDTNCSPWVLYAEKLLHQQGMDSVPNCAAYLSRCGDSVSGAVLLPRVVRFKGGIPDTLVPMLKLPLLAGVLGTAITMVAMEYFLFGFDNSSAMKKMFWFCVMLLPPLGPSLYCFMVYSRSDVVGATTGDRLDRVQP